MGDETIPGSLREMIGRLLANDQRAIEDRAVIRESLIRLDARTRDLALMPERFSAHEKKDDDRFAEIARLSDGRHLENTTHLGQIDGSIMNLTADLNRSRGWRVAWKQIIAQLVVIGAAFATAIVGMIHFKG